MKLVKVLKGYNMVRVVTKTFQRPILGSKYYLAPFWISCDVKKIVEVANNHHAMENSHIFFVHIFQYFFITWGRGEMIVIRRRNMAFVLGKHLWSQMKMKRKKFGKSSSLYILHDNPKLHRWILHPTYSKPKPTPLWLSFFHHPTST